MLARVGIHPNIVTFIGAAQSIDEGEGRREGGRRKEAGKSREGDGGYRRICDG